MLQIDTTLSSKLIATAVCGSEDNHAAIAALLSAAGFLLPKPMTCAQLAEFIADVALAVGVASTSGARLT